MLPACIGFSLLLLALGPTDRGHWHSDPGTPCLASGRRRWELAGDLGVRGQPLSALPSLGDDIQPLHSGPRDLGEMGSRGEATGEGGISG